MLLTACFELSHCCTNHDQLCFGSDRSKALVFRCHHPPSIPRTPTHSQPQHKQSELPFRMLCRAHGAQAAYTPMFHARLFVEHEYYRCA